MGQLAKLVSVQIPQNVEGSLNDSPRPLSEPGSSDVAGEFSRTHNEPTPVGKVQGRTHGTVDPRLESLRKEGLTVAHKGESVAVEHELLQLHGRKIP